MIWDMTLLLKHYHSKSEIEGLDYAYQGLRRVSRDRRSGCDNGKKCLYELAQLHVSKDE